MNILIIIPARGGSKGIARKNLRMLSGKPLIYYAIKTALDSKYNPDVYVSSDDDEILSISKKLGSKIIKRDCNQAKDKTTLDPVIFDAFEKIKKTENKEYDLIITLQATSPLLKTFSLDSAIQNMLNNDIIDTMISASDDTHLTWKQKLGKYSPNYKERLNRQYLTPVFKETGGFLITRSNIISSTNRIGNNTELYLLENGENIDIDTYEDWNICEYYLKRKRILFVVSGYQEIGLGHVYNTLLLANDILDHQIEFLVDNKSKLAYDKINSKNYIVHFQEHTNIIDDIKHINPEIVINDILDTEKEYILELKKLNLKVINFEDLGPGAKFADLVINAIYPEKEILLKHYFGHEYFVLRDEFMLSTANVTSKDVNNILLTFGGVDPNNYTKKVLDAIYDYCNDNKISISVVAGFGYKHYTSLEKFKNIFIYKNISDISEYMKKANIIFSSAGRTAYEIASLNIPAIIMAQNERELSHFFTSEENGFINLGLGLNTDNKDILSVFSNLVLNYELRKYMSELMAKRDLRSGRKRTIKLIKNIVN